MVAKADALRFFEALAAAKERGATDQEIGGFFQQAASAPVGPPKPASIVNQQARERELDKGMLSSMGINPQNYNPGLVGRFADTQFTGDFQTDLRELNSRFNTPQTPSQARAEALAGEDLALPQPDVRTPLTADYRRALDTLFTLNPNVATSVEGPGGKGDVYMDVGTGYFRQGDPTRWGDAGPGGNLGQYSSIVVNDDAGMLQDLAASPLGRVAGTLASIITPNPYALAAIQGGIAGAATKDFGTALRAAGGSLAQSAASDIVNSTITGNWEGNLDPWLPGDAAASGSLESTIGDWARTQTTPITDSLFGSGDKLYFDEAGNVIGKEKELYDAAGNYIGSQAPAATGYQKGLLGTLADAPGVRNVLDALAAGGTVAQAATGPEYRPEGPSMVEGSPAFDPSIQIPAEVEMENVSRDELFDGELIAPEYRLDPADIVVPGLPSVDVEEEAVADEEGAGGSGGAQEAQGDQSAPQVPGDYIESDQDAVQSLDDYLEELEEDQDSPFTPDFPIPDPEGEVPSDTPAPQVPNVPAPQVADTGGGGGLFGGGGLLDGEPTEAELLDLFKMPWIRRLPPMEQLMVAKAVAKSMRGGIS